MNQKQQKDFLFNNINAHDIQQFLDNNSNLNLIDIKDQKLNNIIHKAAYRNKFQIIKLFVDHQTRYFIKVLQTQKDYQKIIKNKIIAWINQQNKQGFTPLLYACSKGQLECVKYLQSIGANMNHITSSGLNILHLSSQGNKLNILMYLHQKIDLNSTDYNGMTPLHWACSMANQQIVTFLLSRKVFLNLQNKKKQTALHLATFYGNTRIVRRLLLKGVDRTIINGDGQKALQIAKKNEFLSIYKMLNNQYSFIDQMKFYYNIQIKYEPQDRSISKPILFFFAYLYTLTTTIYLIKFNINQIYLTVPIIYFLLMLILYISLIKKPILNSKTKNIYDLINKKSICPQCQIIKKQRSHHCQICKMCIEGYDHHCPWINNCVGKSNIGRFILFLIMLLLGLSYIVLANVLFLMNKFCTFRFQTLIDDKLYFKIIIISMSSINLIISLVFYLPIIPLIVVQITNLFLNKTTFQRFTKIQTIKKNQQLTDSNASNDSLTNNRQSLLSSNSNNTNSYSNEQSCKLSNCFIMYSKNDIQQQQSQ